MSNLLLLVIFLISGCGRNIAEVEEQSAVIVFIFLLISILYLSIAPKIQKWDFTRKLMDYFVKYVSLPLILIMVLFGLYLFLDSWLARLLAVNLFITSSFLYKLRNNYSTKSSEERTVDFKYVTITTPSIFALLFLWLGGLHKIF